MRTRSDVCLLSLNFPPEPTGIAPYAGALAAGLGKAGYRVTAHVAHPHYPEWKIRDGYGRWSQRERLPGVDVVRRLHYVPMMPRGLRRLASEVTFGVRLLIARWGKPLVIIAVSPPLFSTAFAALRLRLTPSRPPLIVWVQDIYSLGLTETGQGIDFIRRITRTVEAHVLRSADRVVVIHQRFADFVINELGVPASRVSLVRNWTHLPPSEPIDPAKAKAALGWPSDVTVAVHTGNMGVKQGLENLVDAAKIADEHGEAVHFMLVGGGSERSRLEEHAKGVSRISFIDPLGDVEYRMALEAADVLIVNEKPGVSTMAVPSKLTSYFDAGRPVVAATDVNGITASEVTAAEAGVVVPAGDARAVLDAVIDMQKDPESAARYGANGRRYRYAVLSEEHAIEAWTHVVTTAARKAHDGGNRG